MSAIAGIVRLDGAPVEPPALRRLADRIGARAPEGTFVWCDGPAGLVHGRQAVTSESEDERQPFADPTRRAAITFDGRLDNRSDLFESLRLAPEFGDAALVLRAYEKWGEGAIERLLGEFTMAIWDAVERRLLIARDHSGSKTIYYRLGPGWIAWASSVDVLAAGVRDAPAPNEGMLGEYLCGIVTDKRETVFKDIYRVPPAHQLVASERGIAIRCYWTPDTRHEIRYRRDEEYAEHLAALMRTVVGARLRTPQRVGVMLSGGVDSSSVTGVAAQLCREGTVPSAGLEAFSISIPGPDDERPFFELVTAQWELTAHRLTAAELRAGQFREEIARDLEVQMFPNAPTLEPLWTLARDRGLRVLLTGMGGDDWMGASTWAYADLLKSGRVGALWRRVREEHASADFLGWSAAVHAATWPLAPSGVQRVVRRLLRRGRPPLWIEPAFAARINLADRLARHQTGVRFPTCEQNDIWHEGTSGMTVYSLETATRTAERFGVELWHPFLDRRIVEFGLGLPWDQRWRNGRAKDLLRRAMMPYVPAAVANRLTNPSGSRALVAAIEAEAGPRPFENLATERLGWVKGAEVRAMHSKMQTLYQSGTRGYVAPAWHLWVILATNMWLDAVSVIQ